MKNEDWSRSLLLLRFLRSADEVVGQKDRKVTDCGGDQDIEFFDSC